MLSLYRFNVFNIPENICFLQNNCCRRFIRIFMIEMPSFLDKEQPFALLLPLYLIGMECLF